MANKKSETVKLVSTDKIKRQKQSDRRINKIQNRLDYLSLLLKKKYER